MIGCVGVGFLFFKKKVLRFFLFFSFKVFKKPKKTKKLKTKNKKLTTKKVDRIFGNLNFLNF